jgi:DNA repair photolyase
VVRLPYSVKDLFSTWLEEHYPTKKNKVLNRIRDVRGGKLYSAEFGSRMVGEGIYAEHIEQLFNQTSTKLGLNKRSNSLSTEYFRRKGGTQLSLL